MNKLDIVVLVPPPPYEGDASHRRRRWTGQRPRPWLSGTSVTDHRPGARFSPISRAGAARLAYHFPLIDFIKNTRLASRVFCWLEFCSKIYSVTAMMPSSA